MSSTVMDNAPLATMAVTIVAVVVFALTTLSNGSLIMLCCYSPLAVLSDPLWQTYRVFTSVWVHGNFPHLFLNLLAFVPMAKSLEKSVGTVQFAWLFTVFVLVGAVAHALLAMTLEILVGATVYCSIGMSGVIFALIVCETSVNDVGRRSIFGFFEVSSAWYPVALLCFVQLLMPGASFIGHAAGLLSGYAYVKGYMNWVLLRDTHVTALEEWQTFAPVRAHASFISGVGHSARPNVTSGTANVIPSFRNIPFVGSSSGAFSGEGQRLGGNGSTTGGMGAFAVDDRKLATLIEMGFDSTEAKQALQQCEGDTSRATQLLTEKVGEENV
jgi:membrane associated rhomboid family serine protease